MVVGNEWRGLLSVAYFGYALMELGWLLLGCAIPLLAVVGFVWQTERRTKPEAAA